MKKYSEMCLHVYVKREKKMEVELLDYAYAMCASHFVIQRSWIFVSHFWFPWEFKPS